MNQTNLYLLGQQMGLQVMFVEVTVLENSAWNVELSNQNCYALPNLESKLQPYHKFST